MSEEIPVLIDLGNKKDNQDQVQLISLVAPLIESMTSRILIKDLSYKQKLNIRMHAFIWGYLNNLTYSNAKKIAISTNNKKVLLSSSLSLHSILFNNSVKDCQLEYEAFKSVYDNDANQVNREEFLNGAKAAKEDIEQLGEENPNKSSTLPNLNYFLLKKYEQIKKE